MCLFFKVALHGQENPSCDQILLSRSGVIQCSLKIEMNKSVPPALREHVELNPNMLNTWIEDTILVRRHVKTRQTHPLTLRSDDNEGSGDPSPMHLGAVIRAPGSGKGNNKDRKQDKGRAKTRTRTNATKHPVQL